MKVIIEGHKYQQADVQKYLWDGAFKDIQGYVSIGYVGYYYNPNIPDCVFILPKVLLEDVNNEELVFGKYRRWQGILLCGLYVAYVVVLCLGIF